MAWLDNVQKRVREHRKESAKCIGVLDDQYQMFKVEIVVRVPGENATAEHIKELIDVAFKSFVDRNVANNKEE